MSLITLKYPNWTFYAMTIIMQYEKKSNSFSNRVENRRRDKTIDHTDSELRN